MLTEEQEVALKKAFRAGAGPGMFTEKNVADLIKWANIAIMSNALLESTLNGNTIIKGMQNREPTFFLTKPVKMTAKDIVAQIEEDHDEDG